MPVEGAGGESGTATHRLANRAQRRAGERRAPGSRSQNTGMRGQAGGSMAVRGRVAGSMHQTHPSTACGTAPPGNNNAQPPGDGAGARQARATRKRRGSTRPGTGAGKSGQTGGGAQAQGARQARRRRGRAGGGGDKRAKARGRAAQRGAHANQRGRPARRRWGTGCRGGSGARCWRQCLCVCVLQVVRTLTCWG